MSIPFFRQETAETCVPACLRMVMAYWGVKLDESILRDCCQTTRLGTTFRNAAACARRHNLVVDEIRDAAWSDLLAWLNSGIYPIVSINLFPLNARWAAHAVVVESADEQIVTYLDPLIGRQESPRVAFEQAWQMRRGKALLVRHFD